jgi:hypothetical protein
MKFEIPDEDVKSIEMIQKILKHIENKTPVVEKIEKALGKRVYLTEQEKLEKARERARLRHQKIREEKIASGEFIRPKGRPRKNTDEDNELILERQREKKELREKRLQEKKEKELELEEKRKKKEEKEKALALEKERKMKERMARIEKIKNGMK